MNQDYGNLLLPWEELHHECQAPQPEMDSPT
jgi:hypothetical protein